LRRLFEHRWPEQRGQRDPSETLIAITLAQSAGIDGDGAELVERATRGLRDPTRIAVSARRINATPPSPRTIRATSSSSSVERARIATPAPARASPSELPARLRVGD
jgi:hypothetical protein